MNIIQIIKSSLKYFYNKEEMLDENQIFYVAGSQTLPPPLEPEEEEKILKKLDSEEDTKARQTLVERNLRLVVYIAKKFENTGSGIEDLVSIGTIGLMKAINTFKTDKNIKLATYASRCIENEILMSFRKQKGSENIVYLDDNLEINNDSSKISLKESLRDDFETEEFFENRETRREISTLVAEKLQGRERQIIIMRYGIGGTEPMTQQRVSEILGISRSYVSRLETKAINTLRQELTATANSSE